jgi:ABC-type multidrug transport system fused ATPase/permease subunit
MKKEKEKQPSLKVGVWAIWKQIKPLKREFVILIFLGLVSAIANGFIPYITGHFFDSLVRISDGKNSSVAGIPLWGALLFVWALTQLVANNIDWIIDRKRRKVDSLVYFTIQTNGFTHLLKLPLSYHKNAHINGVLQKISQAGWRISAILRTVIGIAPQFVSILIGISLAASISPLLAEVLAVGVLTYILLLLRILSPIAQYDSEAHDALNDAWDDAAATVQQTENVKQAAAEEYEIKKTRGAFLGNSFKLWVRLENMWSNISFFQRMIVLATQLAVFILSVSMVSAGTISVGQLIALNGYAMMFFGPFVQLGYSWQVIQNGITSAVRADEIFSEKTEVYRPLNARAPKTITGSVVFENVTFAYEAGQTPILENTSFKIEPGEIIAFVGESGVGKSTAISLISGYYFPTSGTVYIDGIDSRQHDLANLRSHIGVVPQEVALFNESIKDNIRYGSFQAKDREVKAAAKEAHLDTFIESLPKKYETTVGERGVKLSVGQKQRVAIARAMLRNPSILILDEPTSALDSQTERSITESLERLMAGRTTFIIAHRLSTVRKANRIFYFEKGIIAESGSHDALMAIEGGKYRSLYEMHIGLH